MSFISLEGGGLFGTGVTAGDIGGILGQIFNGNNSAMPGGAPISQYSGGGGMFDLPGIDIVPQGQGGACGTPFRANGCGGATAQRHIKISPKGKPVWFGPIGNPILFTGDLAATRRVDKVAKRAARGRRRPR